MKFAIAVHGTRGDVEPAAALALELHLPIACTDGALRSALGRAGVKLA